MEKASPVELKLEAVVRPAQTQAKAESEGKRQRLWGLGLCAAAGFSYGFQALLVKWAYAEGVNVTTVLTMRFVIATIGVWGLVAVVRPALRQPRRKLAGLGLLGLLFVTNALTYYLALDLLAAGTTTLLVYCFPVLVVIWATLFFGERLGFLRLIALALAVLGCLLTVDPVALLTTSGQAFSLLGALFAFASALSNSFYVVLSAPFGRGVPGLVQAAWSVPVTALVYIIWCLISGQFQFGQTPLGWACCLGIGILTAFSIGAYLAGIGLIGSSRAAITATTEPATAVILSILLLGEPASPLKLLGGVLIIGAVLILSRPNPHPKELPDANE